MPEFKEGIPQPKETELTHWNRDAAARSGETSKVLESPSHLSVEEREYGSTSDSLVVSGEPKDGDKIKVKFEDKSGYAIDEYTFKDGKWNKERVETSEEDEE